MLGSKTKSIENHKVMGGGVLIERVVKDGSLKCSHLRGDMNRVSHANSGRRAGFCFLGFFVCLFFGCPAWLVGS